VTKVKKFHGTFAGAEKRMKRGEKKKKEGTLHIRRQEEGIATLRSCQGGGVRVGETVSSKRRKHQQEPNPAYRMGRGRKSGFFKSRGGVRG